MKTAKTIEQAKAEAASDQKPEKYAPGQHPNSKANLVAPWTAETHPKSPGRPKDTAADISRKAFENNQEAIYQAVSKKLLAGDAYAYSVHSDRAYGKLKETKEVHVSDEVTDANLNQRITELLRDLGIAGEIDEAGGIDSLIGDQSRQKVLK